MREMKISNAFETENINEGMRKYCDGISERMVDCLSIKIDQQITDLNNKIDQQITDLNNKIDMRLNSFTNNNSEKQVSISSKFHLSL
jgi:hypothetical protein